MIQNGSSYCLWQNPVTFIFPCPLQARTSDLCKEQTTGHPQRVSIPDIIQLDLLLLSMRDAYHPFITLWKGKWLLSLGSFSGVSPFKCQICSVLPVSGTLSHVFCSCYVEVGAHLTPPEHNPTVLPLRPAPCASPLLPPGIPADSGSWDASRPIRCPCMDNPECS